MIHNYVKARTTVTARCVHWLNGDATTRVPSPKGGSLSRYDMRFQFEGFWKIDPQNACYVIRIDIVRHASHSEGRRSDIEPADRLFWALRWGHSRPTSKSWWCTFQISTTLYNAEGMNINWKGWYGEAIVALWGHVLGYGEKTTKPKSKRLAWLFSNQDSNWL